MDRTSALDALSALGHGTRLDVFRLLVREGADGLPAGEIATRLDVRQNTLSSNLAILHRAGLVIGRREGRSIRYAADVDGMRALLGYLLEDCCGGRADLCRPALEAIGGTARGAAR